MLADQQTTPQDKRVLVVEDEFLVAMDLSAELKKRGYDENISLGNTSREIIEAAHLDVADAGVAHGKALAQAISNMGKADGEARGIGKRT